MATTPRDKRGHDSRRDGGRPPACLLTYSHPLIPRPGGGGLMRPASRREPGRGGRARDEKVFPSSYRLRLCCVLVKKNGTASSIPSPSSSFVFRFSSEGRLVSRLVSPSRPGISFACLSSVLSPPQPRLVGRLVLSISPVRLVFLVSICLRHSSSASSCLLCGRGDGERNETAGREGTDEMRRTMGHEWQRMSGEQHGTVPRIPILPAYLSATSE